MYPACTKPDCACRKDRKERSTYAYRSLSCDSDYLVYHMSKRLTSNMSGTPLLQVREVGCGSRCVVIDSPALGRLRCRMHNAGGSQVVTSASPKPSTPHLNQDSESATRGPKEGRCRGCHEAYYGRLWRMCGEIIRCFRCEQWENL